MIRCNGIEWLFWKNGIHMGYGIFKWKRSTEFLLKALPSVALGCSGVLGVLGGTESRVGSLVAAGINANIYKGNRSL